MGCPVQVDLSPTASFRHVGVAAAPSQQQHAWCKPWRQLKVLRYPFQFHDLHPQAHSCCHTLMTSAVLLSDTWHTLSRLGCRRASVRRRACFGTAGGARGRGRGRGAQLEGAVAQSRIQRVLCSGTRTMVAFLGSAQLMRLASSYKLCLLDCIAAAFVPLLCLNVGCCAACLPSELLCSCAI